MSTSIKGTVVKKPFAIGSKSERDAVFLVSTNNEWVLRQKNGNAFHDPTLDSLVGKTITATGMLHGNVFLMEKWI